MPRRTSTLSHVDARGRIRMVDVSAKRVTSRAAVASAVVDLGRTAFEQLAARAIAKGDALTTAKLAGIQAAKRTCELIPLCHGLAPDHIDVQIELRPPRQACITATVRLAGKTGVEMEALVAASVAALTLYDMCKAVSKDITIGPIRLESKTGGKSGRWTRK
jgi:molybdenum cofactor biosynthesis protein MoaC